MDRVEVLFLTDVQEIVVSRVRDGDERALRRLEQLVQFGGA